MGNISSTESDGMVSQSAPVMPPDEILNKIYQCGEIEKKNDFYLLTNTSRIKQIKKVLKSQEQVNKYICTVYREEILITGAKKIKSYNKIIYYIILRDKILKLQEKFGGGEYHIIKEYNRCDATKSTKSAKTPATTPTTAMYKQSTVL